MSDSQRWIARSIEGDPGRVVIWDNERKREVLPRIAAELLNQQSDVIGYQAGNLYRLQQKVSELAEETSRLRNLIEASRLRE